MKFKQAALMREAVDDDTILTELIGILQKPEYPRDQWQSYLSSIRACSVFVTRGPSEFLVGGHVESIISRDNVNRKMVVMQSIARTVFIKTGSAEVTLSRIMSLHRLRAAAPVTLTDLAELARMGGSYFVRATERAAKSMLPTQSA